MTVATLPRAKPAPLLDYNLIATGLLYLGVLLALCSVFTPDPIPVAVGAFVPWLCIRIVATPGMPAAIVYLLVWQWVQIYARVTQTWIDGDTLATSMFGPSVAKAYWYMLASLVVYAVGIRAVLGRLKAPTLAQRTAHYTWNLNHLLTLYGVTMAFSTVAGSTLRNALPSLQQPIEALAQTKIVVLVMLFIYVLTTGRGFKIMLGVVLFEVGLGFTGLLSDFRGVFIFLAVSAIAARIRWTGTVALGSAIGLVVLSGLALFWTSVKMDYRNFASNVETQTINRSLGDRMGYLGGKALGAGDMSLAQSSYMLIIRLAYVDIFGSVISLQEISPEPVPMRQWQEALEHVLTPRFINPNKPVLSDSDVFVRLTRGLDMEDVQLGTSISVGYMGENYADLHFPGMLLGIAVIGFMVGGVTLMLMRFHLPQAMREGMVMGLMFIMARDGVEVSLPKLLGGMIMFTIVFLFLNKFVFPKIMEWLNRNPAAASLKHS